MAEEARVSDKDLNWLEGKLGEADDATIPAEGQRDLSDLSDQSDLSAAQDRLIDTIGYMPPVREQGQSAWDRLRTSVSRAVNAESPRIQAKAEADIMLRPSTLRAAVLKLGNTHFKDGTPFRLGGSNEAFSVMTQCFMQFCGTFGTFIKESVKRDNNGDNLLEAATTATMELGKTDNSASPFSKTTFFTKDRARWTVAAIATMAGAQARLTKTNNGKTPLDAAVFNIVDDGSPATLKPLDSVNMHQVDLRLMNLAYDYMIIRKKASMGGGIGQDAKGEAVGAIRYQLWMQSRFSNYTVANLAADYLHIGMRKKIGVSVEMFMMEFMYTVFRRMLDELNYIHDHGKDGDEIVGEGAMARVMEAVRLDIRDLFDVTLDNMKTRVFNSKYYLGQFIACTTASAALLSVFLAIPNPPGLLGAIQFTATFGMDGFTEMMKEYQRRRVDAHSAVLVNQMATFYSSVEASKFFVAEMSFDANNLVQALTAYRKATHTNYFWKGGAGGDSYGVMAVLAAVTVFAAFLGSA
jgi:hypothetical protein